MTSLVLCPSCSRHVRASESSCPFCSHALPEGLVPAPYVRRRQVIGKGATALALALAASGCSEGATADESLLDASVAEVGADTASDGAAEAATDAAPDTFASDARDDGGAVPIYK